jgi:hypothetical protein
VEAIIVAFLLQSNSKVPQLNKLDDFDHIYIAHCYPYTYTQLQKYLKTIEQDPVKKNRFQRKFLCLTESGNKFYIINLVVII